ncbi:HNH endonuclease [Streptomyces sp. P1-3]|uniref:HNH endonuclease n=1 Tax=Streptomyces sp. P1-3 TaxID=3421658 RepID=UPI003D35D04A
MTGSRPAIPRELRRRVLIEAGHRCAIPACRATPVEIAHIAPWVKVKKHEFKNLIALCPTCHTRFDDPHNPLDRKAMRQYKANLNPLLSLEVDGKGDQVRRIAAYQDFRAQFGAWVRSLQEFGAVKSKRKATPEDAERARHVTADTFASALISALDFQNRWKGTRADDIANAIFYHVADWADELSASEFPAPRSLGRRDIADEISEASIDLHLAVCVDVGILGPEDV